MLSVLHGIGIAKSETPQYGDFHGFHDTGFARVFVAVALQVQQAVDGDDLGHLRVADRAEENRAQCQVQVCARRDDGAAAAGCDDPGVRARCREADPSVPDLLRPERDGDGVLAAENGGRGVRTDVFSAAA